MKQTDNTPRKSLWARLTSRTLACPGCSGSVRLPTMWTLGVEVIIRCPHCKQSMKTGYLVGAAIMGLSLAVSVALANVLVWIFSSATLLVFTALIVPFWLLLAYILRRLVLIRKYKIKSIP